MNRGISRQAAARTERTDQLPKKRAGESSGGRSEPNNNFITGLHVPAPPTGGEVLTGGLVVAQAINQQQQQRADVPVVVPSQLAPTARPVLPLLPSAAAPPRARRLRFRRAPQGSAPAPAAARTVDDQAETTADNFTDLLGVGASSSAPAGPSLLPPEHFLEVGPSRRGDGGAL